MKRLHLPGIASAIGLLLHLAPAWAGADISIGPLYDYLPGATSSITKLIRNDGDETGFLRVEVKRMVFDDKGQTHEIEQSTDDALKDRLIVSPSRLIVPAKGARSTRILYVGKRDHEQYFRVRYHPVLPTRQEGFDITEQAEQQSARAGLKLLVGYGEIVFVRPAVERYDTTFNRHASGLTISNNGNATIVLDNYRTCFDDKKPCAEPIKKLLLPGRKLDVSAPDLSSVSLDLIEGKQTRKKHFEFPA